MSQRGDEGQEPVRLETARLWLIGVTPQEAAGLYLDAADGALLRRDHWVEGFPLVGTRAGAHMMLGHVAAGTYVVGYGVYLMTLRESGEVVGDIGFHGPPDAVGSVEVGYGLVEPLRGRGLVIEALDAVCAWVWSQPDVRVIRAEADLPNAASRGVLQHVGFVPDGVKDGTYHYHLERPSSS